MVMLQSRRVSSLSTRIGNRGRSCDVRDPGWNPEIQKQYRHDTWVYLGAQNITHSLGEVGIPTLNTLILGCPLPEDLARVNQISTLPYATGIDHHRPTTEG